MAARCWRRNRIRRRFAEALALLVRTAPDPATVSTLAPSPAWIGWDHAAETLWPGPDDRDGDLNEHPGDRWLGEIGTAARGQLLALDRPAVIGHGACRRGSRRRTHQD